MGIICCYKEVLGRQNSLEHEATNFINQIINTLKIRELNFITIYTLIMEEDFDEANFLEKIKKKEKIHLKRLLNKAGVEFYIDNNVENPFSYFHQNIFSMLGFIFSEKDEAMIKCDLLLSFLIPFSRDNIKEKIRFFLLLNKTKILGDKEEELNLLNKKSNLRDLIQAYLNYFIKILTESVSDIIQKNRSKYSNVIFDLNILLALGSENRQDIFFSGFFKEEIDALPDDFDENDLLSFFTKNSYIFDIIELRNHYFNLKN